jgi:prolyl oligopeptidase
MRVWLFLCAVGCSASTPVSKTVASAALTPPSSMNAPRLAYPQARRGDTVETHFGTKVADPYRWLEAMDSPDTHAWVVAENALSEGELSKIPGRGALRARVAELMSYESFGVPRRRGNRYFWIHHDGRQAQPTLWTAPSLDAAATLLVDPNTFSTDGSLAFAGASGSDNGTRIAYGLSIGGGDWQRWRVRDVATGKDLPDELEHIKYYRPAFTRDGTGIYYSRFPAPQKGQELTETDHDCKVYFHRMGTGVGQDVVVYERPDQPTWQFDPVVTPDGRYLVITIGDGQVGDRSLEQVAYLDLSRRGAKVTPLITTYDAEYLLAGNEGPVFFFKTNLDAPRKRVVAIDTRSPARKNWKTIVAEGPNAIDDANAVGRQLFVTTLQDAHHAVGVYDLKGSKLRDVALAGLGTVYGFLGPADAKETFFGFTGFTAPDTVYRYDMRSGSSQIWKAPRVPFDPSAFEARQIFFPSKDGTKVPMFVTAKKGLVLDGQNPTIMTAYGFGGIPSLPWFEAPMIAWMERGGLFVVVNIRGGGEYGEDWHRAAMRTHRQVGYDDFIAAGEWLVANKYTAREHLGIIGTSGGGMLVGAVLVQRPELFGAAVPIAGVLDLLRFQLFGQGAGWQGDMGSPEEASEFPTLHAISPLHNIRAGTTYPPTLVITSDHDVRVAPLHSYKFAAALQHAQAGPAPILLKVETESGHGGGSTLAQKIEQSTDWLGFLGETLGLEPK